MARGLAVSPDDREVIVGDYNEVVARDIRTGARKWRREAREWAYSPDTAAVGPPRRRHAGQGAGDHLRRDRHGTQRE